MAQIVTLNVPDALFQDALELGILENETLLTLIQDELDRRVIAMVSEEVHNHRHERSALDDANNPQPTR